MTDAIFAITLPDAEPSAARVSEGDTVILISLARTGDMEAFDHLMQRYERLVLMTALRCLNGNMADAQDAAQAVFLRLHRSLGTFRNSGDAAGFSAWLYRVTVNICRDMNRRTQRRGEVELSAGSDVAMADHSETALDESRQRQALAASLQQLGEKERAAIVLRDIEGLETREVASILGSSEATVRSQISVGRRKMRKFVEGYLRRPL